MSARSSTRRRRRATSRSAREPSGCSTTSARPSRGSTRGRSWSPSGSRRRACQPTWPSAKERSGSAAPGGEDITNATVSVSRMDPKTGRITHTVRLRGEQGSLPVAGAPRIAVGAGAVWAANPDGSVSRIDPETGRLEATIDTGAEAWTIAAGDEGVWFLGTDETGVGKIDPRTNRVTRVIPVGADDLFGIAVGAGRFGPWRATKASYGGSTLGALQSCGRSTWASASASSRSVRGRYGPRNYVDGVVSRIDPRTNNVTRPDLRRRSAGDRGGGGLGVGQRRGAGRPRDHWRSLDADG